METKLKVAVVDDEPHARLLIKDILGEAYETREAESVLSALDLFSEWIPDIILSDIKMPGEDGISLLKKCKSQFPDVPVILITGHADKAIALEALKEGAFDFIEKPFEDEELIATTERAANMILLKQKLDQARTMSIEAEKLATVGLMAGGIAHEINNPLGVILLLASSLKSKSGKPDDVLMVSQKISDTVMKITKIIKSLQSFSRNSSGTPFLDTSVKKIVDDVLNLCGKRLTENSVEMMVDNESMENLVIQCRESEIAQVLFNLVNNANDAIKDLDNKWIKVACEDNDKTVKIIVKDSGPGIPEDLKNKIFHPFFTTKEIGKGTGLGLAVSVGIIEAHNGIIEIDSEAPNTTFIIQVPKVQLQKIKLSA